ncbi:DUF4265 domain-containing protein [Catenulispora yoronensis]|uniref:DUF4265 domain-containing protein n=1 Tax=Catenulispora yoronensis TaxID=450799 RepID=UPI0031CFFCAC
MIVDEGAGRPEAEMVKVVFKLHQDETGWPPAGSERLWAVSLGDDLARLDNVPFFVRGYAMGDVVRFATDRAGVHWVQEAVRYSDNCTIRIMPGEGGGRDEVRQAVLDAFAPYGVTGEGIARFGMVALNVPGAVDVASVKKLLEEGEEDGRWEFEEGCVTEAWRTAGR